MRFILVCRVVLICAQVCDILPRHTFSTFGVIILESKDQIIELGKILRAEQERGCDDGAAAGGLDRYLTGWRMAANGALQYAPVAQALELLAGYSVFDAATRRARVG